MDVKEIEKKYDEYLEKFAAERKITKEAAKQYQSIVNYKVWLEEEYNVKIGR